MRISVRRMIRKLQTAHIYFGLLLFLLS
jgi:hypothetical protein